MKNKFIKALGIFGFTAIFILTFISFIVLLSSPDGAVAIPVILFSLPFLAVLFTGVFFVLKDRFLSFLYCFVSAVFFCLIYLFLAPEFYDSQFKAFWITGLILSVMLLIYSFSTPFVSTYIIIKKPYKIGLSCLLAILLVAVIFFFVVFYKVILINPVTSLPIG